MSSNPILQMQADTYNDNSYRSATELSTALQANVPMLTEQVIQLSYAMGGNWRDANFPMLTLTQGKKQVKSVDGVEYKLPIMGRIKRTSVIAYAPYSTSAQLGKGITVFELYFGDRWFYNQQELYLYINGTKRYVMRVQKDPIQIGNYYKYTVKLMTSSYTDYILGSDLNVGTIIAGGIASSAIEDSEGVESRSQLGGMATNMIKFTRSSTKIAGNVQNKVMKYTLNVDGKSFKLYQDWNLFLADMDFKNATEEDMWWSKYTKSSTGQYTHYDENTGKPVTSGAGLDEQIWNSTTFSSITYNKMAKTIRDVVFSSRAGKSAILDLWTGTGGKEEFSDSMIDKLKSFGFIQTEKFLEGKSMDLSFGGLFTSFKHNDGPIVNIHCHPGFDHSAVADAAPRHPITGLPITSHNFYFIDRSMYNGMQNVVYVQEKGREYQQYSINGNIEILGWNNNSKVRQTSKDRAEIHASNSTGVHILNTAACFKMICTAS